MINAIVVEDEQHGKEYLIGVLEEYLPDIAVMGSAGNIADGLDLIETKEPDLVFLDIHMPRGTGFDLIDKIKNRDVHVIFTTAHRDYAIQAIKIDLVHDYLVKPIDVEELETSIDRLRKKLIKQQSNTRISIPYKGDYELVEAQSIAYVQGEGSYSTIFFVDGRQVVLSKRLKLMEEKMPSFFSKPHKSYLVNLKEVQRFSKSDGKVIVLKNGMRVPISRRMKERFLKIIAE